MKLPHYQSLAFRAFYCRKNWRWIDGMVALVDGPLGDRLPDFTKPATMGCLLELARGLFGGDFHVVPIVTQNGTPAWEPRNGKGVNLANGEVGLTEAEAIIMALEAAE